MYFGKAFALFVSDYQDSTNKQYLTKAMLQCTTTAANCSKTDVDMCKNMGHLLMIF